MSDNVIQLHEFTTMDIPVERVLDGAKEANLKHAIVIGFDEDGEDYIAGSTSDPREILLMCEKMKKYILDNL